jgi:hypothetical protein
MRGPLRLLGLLLLVPLGIAPTTLAPLPARAQPAPSADTDQAQDKDDADDETSKGTLVVTARSQKGGAIADVAVTIDTKPMGELEDGEMTLTNNPGGRHAIAIAAPGYQRFEQSVIVREGERTRLDALLVAEVQRAKPPLWKWTLGVSVSVLVAAGAYGLYGHSREFANRDAIVISGAPNPDGGFYANPTPIQTNDCGKSTAEIAFIRHAVVLNQDRFDRMCTWRDKTFIALGFGGVGLIGAFVSLYMLTTDRRADPGGLGIVPTVTPHGGGASLSLTW